MLSFIFTAFRFLRGLWAGFKDPEFRGLFGFVLVLLASGTAFYSSVEHWRILDSLYFSVTTLATVGYSDLTPQTDIGKVFTMFYILIGVGTLLGFINLVAHHTQENDPIHSFLIGKPKEKKQKDE